MLNVGDGLVFVQGTCLINGLDLPKRVLITLALLQLQLVASRKGHERPVRTLSNFHDMLFYVGRDASLKQITTIAPCATCFYTLSEECIGPLHRELSELIWTSRFCPAAPLN